MKREHLIVMALWLAGLYGCGPGNSGQSGHSKPPDYEVRLETVTKHWDGEFNWTQTRVAAIPGMGKDGKPRLIMTMQKWFVSHSDLYSGLYTMQSDDTGATWTPPKEQPALGWRRGANNDHIPRSRAPLFMATVDPDRLIVQNETERIIIPQRGVMMGNFGVSRINDKETWVTVGENMHPPENLHLGADGSVFSERIVWSGSDNRAL